MWRQMGRSKGANKPYVHKYSVTSPICYNTIDNTTQFIIGQFTPVVKVLTSYKTGVCMPSLKLILWCR